LSSHIDKIGTEVYHVAITYLEKDMSDENSRLVITVTGEMHETLKRAAKDKSNTISGISRLALYEWLVANGYTVEDWHVTWGQFSEKDD
jgi:hypothetical protein